MLLPVSRRISFMAQRRLVMPGLCACLLLRGVCLADTLSEDYVLEVWDTEDNLPSSIVTDVTQTPDGYLWVGTYNGLARFDGVRFMTFDPSNTPELGQARVQGLYVDAAGTLWISNFRGGLTSYRGGAFRQEWPDQPFFDIHTALAWSSSNVAVFVTQYGEVLQRQTTGSNGQWTVRTPPGGARPIYQCASRNGVLWFLTREGHIVRFMDGEFKDLPDDGGLAGHRVFTLATDPRGRIWAGATNEIARWDGTRFEPMTPTNGESTLQPQLLFPTRDGALWVLDGVRLRKQVGRQWVAEAVEWRGLLGRAANRATGVHEDRDGGVWFNHYGNGLFHATPDGRFQRLTTRDGLRGDRIGAWFQSRDGNMWLGIDRGGLSRLRQRRFHVVDLADDLTPRTALSVCEGRDGAIWIGTGGGGLCRWSNGTITRFQVGPNVSANFVFSMFPRADGGLWLSAAEGEEFYEFQDGRMQHAPWEGVRGIKSLLTDHAGRVWIGTKANLAWWSPTDRRSFTTSDGLTLSAVRALAEAPDGIVWSGADDGTLYRCQPDRLQAFRPHDALTNRPIWSLLADQDGAVWVGTFRGGLLRFKGGKFFRFTAKQGLPVDVVSQILEDDRGQIWLGTHQGICRASKAALNACADGRVNTVDFPTYGKLHGLPTLECSDGYQPACWRGSDGRLWFTTVKGVVSVNPAEVLTDSLPPPVDIKELRVDGEPVPLRPDITVIPPGHKQFEFRFDALNFNVATRFRYRIDELDSDWAETDARTVRYGYLPPNTYHFRVIACNDENVWRGSGAAAVFTVQQFFYKTWWFLTLSGIGVLGAVVLAVRAVATKKYRGELARLAQQHAVERDRTRIARDIHDDIGAGLTQITLLSELARREPEQTTVHLQRISDSARQLTRAMDEIVWAVDPQHDTFHGLMDYISAFAEDFLRTAGIPCRMDLPMDLPAVRVDAEMRYHLFLALKEVLNNIVKHAHATEVRLGLRFEPGAFTLIIEDNGQGLPAARPAAAATIGGDRISSGSGLSNLDERLRALGGRCVIRSDPGRGTRVELSLRIAGMTSPVVAIGADAKATVAWKSETFADR